MFEAAIEELEKAEKLSAGKLNDMYLGRLGLAYGAAGREQEARKVLRTLIELKHEQYVPADSIAEVHTGLGEKAQALDWLEKAYEERSTWLNSLKVDHKWNSLRDEQKFQELIDRIGFNR